MDYTELLGCGLFLLDLDGTLNLGDELIPGAKELISALRARGAEYIYLTNNSSRSAEDYVRRVRELGLPCERRDVFTSGMATAFYLNRRCPGVPVYLVGTRSLRRELEGYGVEITDGEADVVVAGFDRELTFEKLTRAANLLKKGARFIACNPDCYCPMPGGALEPDCASICSLLTMATGEVPYFVGKPNREMVDIISDTRGIKNSRIAIVGDRLYTDMMLAKNAQAVGVCVLTGETTPDTLKTPAAVYDYSFPSVRELAEVLTYTLASGGSTQK